MDFWNEQADKLEKALLDGAPALVLHFLRHDHSAKIRLLPNRGQLEHLYPAEDGGTALQER